MGGDNNKITIMVLKVDFQCCSCYKKVKKILCKFPQIRDQIYDEKGNKVTITVICCNPEKLRDKLCSEGCGVIKSIEIKEPLKPKPPDIKKPIKPKPHPVAPTAPVPVPVQKCPPPPVAPPPVPVPVQECPPPPVAPVPVPVPVLVPVQECRPPPSGYCCGQCYEGHTGGPCYQWYGRPVPPPPCYGNYGPGPYCYNRGCYVSRCDPYPCSDENATGCSIM